MGFWHTGYIEFHEPTGIDPPVALKPRRFFCDRCDRSFASPDELEEHRFADHPLRSPVMIVQGRQLGTSRFQVHRTLRSSDVHIRCCDRARLDSHEIRVTDLPTTLADLSRSSSICCIVLSKDAVEARFELEFRIASVEDLERVESRFHDIARGKRLNSKIVDDFIGPKSHFGTAINYCDGICTYLYGVLAKEEHLTPTWPIEITRVDSIVLPRFLGVMTVHSHAPSVVSSSFISTISENLLTLTPRPALDWEPSATGTGPALTRRYRRTSQRRISLQVILL